MAGRVERFVTDQLDRSIGNKPIPLVVLACRWAGYPAFWLFDGHSLAVIDVEVDLLRLRKARQSIRTTVKRMVERGEVEWRLSNAWMNLPVALGGMSEVDYAYERQLCVKRPPGYESRNSALARVARPIAEFSTADLLAELARRGALPAK